MTRVRKTMAVALLATVLLPLVLVASLLWWATGATSLETSLRLASVWLPAGQTLEFDGVSGGIWRGGTLQRLRWHQGGLSIVAEKLDLQWDLAALQDARLHLPRLQIERLQIDDQRPAVPDAPPVPPSDLVLPLKLDLPFVVQALQWTGSTTLQASDLVGHYRFDQTDHLLSITSLRIASGTYQAQGRLQARSPMALHIEASGTVQTRVPPQGKAVEIEATAQLEGTLGGTSALLDLKSALTPRLSAPGQNAMQAKVQASIQPWTSPTLTQASGQWQALDLAVLWPSAPTTLLDGSAELRPAGAGWNAQLRLTNRQSGPWNLRRLPIEQLTTRIGFINDQWTIHALKATAGGGQIELQGQAADRKHWGGQATLVQINPAALDNRLANNLLNGSLSADQTPQGITFDASIQPTPTAQRVTPTETPRARAILVQSLHAKGLWNVPLLALDTLSVDLQEAQLQGNLLIDTAARSAQGQLSATLPGARGEMAGTLAPTQGRGTLTLDITDAGRLATWFSRWPGLADWLGDRTLTGSSSLNATWDGGWQQQGQALSVKAHWQTPLLQAHSAGHAKTPLWRISDLSADLAGLASNLTLATTGKLVVGDAQLALNARAKGQRHVDGQWNAQLDYLELSAAPQAQAQVQRWQLRLDQSVALHWRDTPVARGLDIAAGSIRLTGPLPGAVPITWQPAQWTQQRSDSAANWVTRWNTQGELSKLPLKWLLQMAQLEATQLGFQGDLGLSGEWSASSQGGEALALQATLQRTTGDLQLLPDDGGSAALQAGVRDARLSLSVVNDEVQAQLRWDSASAGTLDASASTQLQRQGDAWVLSSAAPLQGRVRAQLPQLRVWSLLAPPGWRLRGTLDADATVSGSIKAPQWDGVIQARNLSVRSVLDGVDLSQGQARVHLTGDGLEIVEMSIQGASTAGVSGGMLSLTGTAQWPQTSLEKPFANQLRMNILAKAQALRVNTRPDQRLVVSGELTTTLANAKLTIGGELTADQAAFVLSDDSKPQLGADVRLKAPLIVAPTPRASPAASQSPLGLPITPEIRITLQLGPNFSVQGQGLSTRLTGTLVLSAKGSFQPSIDGVIRTASGTYKAYGQQLDIESGSLRFSGPYDNPSLDVLAIRPNLVQRVGVQIDGTALLPVVRLYSEPDLPDIEKLSWLVVGRADAQGGAQIALLQQAAMAMLGRGGQPLTSGLAQTFGLDEITMTGIGTTDDAGTNSGATFKLGKRLAGNFYVAYERSVAGAYGTFYIFYDLSRRFTLRAQSGEQSAVDVIFTTRYD